MTNENSSLKELFDDMGELFSNTFNENLLPKTNGIKNTKETNCSICFETISGYGNNAEPINSGICCDACNYASVIPKRLDLLSNNLK